jgi:hypothetical protein
VTVCPMCQMNLETYQDKISKEQGEDLRIAILYLPQLMGLAFGMSEKELKMNLNLALPKGFRDKLKKYETGSQDKHDFSQSRDIRKHLVNPVYPVEKE